MRKTKRRRSRVAIFVSLVAIAWSFVIIFAVAYFGVYRVNEARSRERLENRLMGIALSAASLVDGDLHKEIIKGTEDNPDYRRLVSILNGIREANSTSDYQIAYIYTFHRDPDDPTLVRFGLDTGVGDDHSPLNMPYDNPISPVLLSVFENGVALCEPDVVKDQWGYFRTAHAPIFDSAGKVVATLGVDLGAKQPQLITPAQMVLGATVIVGSIFLGILLATLLSPAIMSPLEKLTSAAARVAEGDLQVDLGKERMHFEFGTLATGFGEMIASLRRLVGQVKHSAELVENLSGTLRTSAEQSGQSAVEIAQTMNEMAAGADSVVASVGAAAAELSQIDSLSNQVAMQTAAGSEAMIRARANADHGVTVVTEALQRAREAADLTKAATSIVADFEQWSGEVAQVLEFVSQLAEQIMVLSMNAQIEAARAGEHGVGFSVIAEKIGQLSDDTGELVARMGELNVEMAARVREVGGHIITTESNLAKNVEALDDARGIFAEIARQVKETSELLVQTDESTTELRERIIKGRQEVEAITAVTEEEASAIEEASASSQEQAALAKEIEASVAQLRGLAEQLFAELRNFKV